jgi:hypothetical protein
MCNNELSLGRSPRQIKVPPSFRLVCVLLFFGSSAIRYGASYYVQTLIYCVEKPWHASQFDLQLTRKRDICNKGWNMPVLLPDSSNMRLKSQC